MSADRILSQLLGSGAAAGFAGGLAGSFLTSKAGRRFGRQALRVGGIAAVGGLAYAAYQRHQLNQALARSTPVVDTTADRSRFVPADETSGEAEALGAVLLRAMIAAARADGRLDGSERDAILERARSLPLTTRDRAALLAQLDQPVDMAALVAAAATPEIAAEIYAASLLAIELDAPAEHAYLAMLAARLGLPPGLVESIHEEAGRAGAALPEAA